MLPDDPKPFEAATGHLNDVGPPPETPDTVVQPLTPDTRAAFEARADEAAIRADLREKLIDILGMIGEAAARKFLGFSL